MFGDFAPDAAGPPPDPTWLDVLKLIGKGILLLICLAAIGLGVLVYALHMLGDLSH